MVSSQDVTSLVFFGDSLTDNGNLFALTGGFPPPPYVQGRFSNGPTYAEILPWLVGVPAVNVAFGGAEAVTDPTDSPLQRATNLDAQLATYLGGLPTGGAPDGTAAVINIGNNDYLRIPPTATPAEIGARVEAVLGTVAGAAQTLLASGVDKIILFTLPSVAVTPLGATLPPAQRAGAVAVVEAHNAGLHQLAAGLAAGGVDVEVVDIFRLANELAADKETFGFAVTDQQLILNPGADPDTFAFFDDIHPTREAHEVQAIFAATSLAADRVTLLDAGSDHVSGSRGADLVFAGAGDDVIRAGAGDDTVFAGTGDDTVVAGFGDDLVAGGGGDDHLFGGLGSDLLAGNRGNDCLHGGLGDDALIAGGGADLLFGGFGDDLLYFDETAGMTCTGLADGGLGRDVLFLTVTAETYASASFQDDLADLVDGYRPFRGFGSGEFDELGLALRGIERIEIAVDDILVFAAGAPAPSVDADLARLLTDADLWGLV
jgi:Ca2+-binding RTX toxin-like protein